LLSPRKLARWVVLFTATHVVTVGAAESAWRVSDFKQGEFVHSNGASETEWSPYPLGTGGMNHQFMVRGGASGAGVDITEVEGAVVEFSIHWNGSSTYSPAKQTEAREKQLRALLSDFGVSSSDGLIRHVRAEQDTRYSGGSTSAPWATIGECRVRAGHTGETLWVVLRQL